MKACFWRTCGIVSGGIAIALLVLTATIAVRENPPMSPRYTVLAVLTVTLAVGAIIQVGVSRILGALHDLRAEANGHIGELEKKLEQVSASALDHARDAGYWQCVAESMQEKKPADIIGIRRNEVR